MSTHPPHAPLGRSGLKVSVLGFGCGAVGGLMVRGAQMFMGYYKRPDIETFDAQGWFDTGDLAYMDSDGYIRINGSYRS